MTDTICVSAENISKRFLVFQRERLFLRSISSLLQNKSLMKEHWALRNVSFSLQKGGKLAIVGKNGSGKTTLLRILAGIYETTSGNIKIECGTRALFRFWVGFNGELSVTDNIYLFGAVHGLNRRILEPQVDRILEMAELIHLRFAQLKNLSSGQLQKLAFSVFFKTEGEFMIFDESLVFVDQSFAKKCEIYFKEIVSSGKTVIMTSHDNNFLRAYCQRAIWLDEGRIRMDGKVDDVLSEYEKFSQR
ncbi:MAG: ATP-binding cassette domain-containing protein [Candidatus Omnitrophica bacterium]|nr:ATP-binding cassette domain-containing protein [Candidatus Omnitrophota bacterium]